MEMHMSVQIPRFRQAARLSVLAALLGLSLPSVGAPTLDTWFGANGTVVQPFLGDSNFLATALSEGDGDIPADASYVSGPVETIEFYNAALDHYFLSIDPQEVSDLDRGLHAGWTRTGQSFPVFESAASAAPMLANPVCRFYIPPQHGDSHFFSADLVECSSVLEKMQNDPNFSGYVYESPNVFYAALSDLITGDCPAATTPVYRLWNQRADSNHRYTASLAIKDQMIAVGYVAEGRGPNAVAMCAPGPVKTSRIVVVPLRYQSPPSTSQAAIDAYNKSLPFVTRSAQQALFAQIAAWWSAESYGLNALAVTVLPEVIIPGNPGCDTPAIIGDARAAALAAGVGGYDILVATSTYACWQYHAVTSGNTVVNHNTYQNSAGTVAHELGHVFGLGHNALRMPTYIVYGSCADQMGCLSDTLTHWMSDHKERLSALKPQVCASTTLRSIYTYPDAIRCGDYFLEYLGDWGQVWVHLREYVYSPYGPSDTTDVAKLSQGQSFSADGYTFTHIGGGKVKVTP